MKSAPMHKVVLAGVSWVILLTIGMLMKLFNNVQSSLDDEIVRKCCLLLQYVSRTLLGILKVLIKLQNTILMSHSKFFDIV